MIEELLKELDLFLGDKNRNSLDFSYFLEEFLIREYDKMYRIDKSVTTLANEELPEICAMMEPGMDDIEFRELLKIEYDRISKAYFK